MKLQKMLYLQKQNLFVVCLLSECITVTCLKGFVLSGNKQQHRENTEIVMQYISDSDILLQHIIKLSS